MPGDQSWINEQNITVSQSQIITVDIQIFINKLQLYHKNFILPYEQPILHK
jgi:hypothetical protein